MTLGVTVAPTLADLRARVRARIGSAGSTANRTMNALIDDILREAQDELYDEIDFQVLRVRDEIPLTPGVAEYDFPNDANVERTYLLNVRMSGGLWSPPLVQGIEPELRAITHGPWPRRFEIVREPSGASSDLLILELWPTPSSETVLRIEYQRALLRFTEDTDRVTVPYGPLLQLAIARAKLHYRQPDGARLIDEFDRWRTNTKALQRRKMVVGPRFNRSPADRMDDVYRLPPE